MSYCKREGKDVSVFVTEEDAVRPEVVSSLAEDDEFGLLLPSGEINWSCPCLGGMADGPCGQEFKDSFSCFHYSTEEEKGSDCIPQFKAMQECFQQHPELYSKYSDEEEEEEAEEEEEGKREGKKEGRETGAEGEGKVSSVAESQSEHKSLGSVVQTL